ncbi:hypothetical protein B0J18DRAFT_467340 [Chaetomium sp. MPI-SDFR-AT-0129]|nr:hypothetical protein B0J18DRAFT_467340 [Chaetomium sp. MPI-SDFR-AT-0129]
MASQPRKRWLDAATANESLPAKRTRLARTDPQPGPLRRSARLESQQAAAGIEDPVRIAPSVPPHGPQIEAGVASELLASKGAGLTRANTQQHKPPKVGEQEQVSPATQSHIGGGDDDEHQLKRAPLTRKNLAQFNKMARKKGTNTPVPVPKSTVQSLTANTTSTRTTSATTSGFAIKTYRNGMLPSIISKPPTNYNEIRERQAGSRETPPATELAYNALVDRIVKAPNEATMVFEVAPKLLKEYDGKGYQRALNQPFTGFPEDVGFNNGLSAPQPDFVEGLEMHGFDPFPVEEDVDGAVLYKDNPFSVTLPHLAGEWKGRGKDMDEAELQARYDGAALVYARNKALAYLGKSDPPGHAAVTTFTTNGTILNFYAHYAAEAEDKTLKYHQYPISSINLVESLEAHNEGRRRLRNEQDHAFKQSCALRDELKEHWKRHRDDIHPTVEGPPLPLPGGTSRATNVDEDEAGHGVVELPTPATFSQPPKGSSSVSSSKPFPSAQDHVPRTKPPKRKASSPSAPLRESTRLKNK